ncbi:MAG: hypothetical protein U5K54_26825 [Cytophagales bacterium]|nr:hypothetical protein [Cytophagales bacterium]
MAIGEYSTEALGISIKVIAVFAIILVSAIHWFGVKTGGRVQTFLTGLKIIADPFLLHRSFFITSVK